MPVPAARPGADPNWRVTVEEIELLETDEEPPFPIVPRSREPRVVYADHLPL